MMPRNVTVGLDGSPESRAAAEWAAREATLRGLTLKLAHVWEAVPDPIAQAPLLGAETLQHWTERVPREAAEGLRLRHPGLEVTTEQFTGRPAEVLAREAKEAELLVLGSRAMSGIGGFLVGSVGYEVVAHANRPVVLVRAGEQALDEHGKDPAGIPSTAAPYLPVVLGLDTDSPDEALIGFALDAAVRRATSLRVVHGWNPSPYIAYGVPADIEGHRKLAQQEAAALTEVMRPWRQKFPDLSITEESHYGSPASYLVDASADASLVVVGRRHRRAPLRPHIGPITHAVLHHATAPVAVVAHD